MFILKKNLYSKPPVKDYWPQVVHSRITRIEYMKYCLRIELKP